jgi:hypothetical protein
VVEVRDVGYRLFRTNRRSLAGGKRVRMLQEAWKCVGLKADPQGVARGCGSGLQPDAFCPDAGNLSA